jgi:hypothetical protein
VGKALPIPPASRSLSEPARDLFTSREGDLQAATEAVVMALANADFTVTLIEDELGGFFDGFEQDRPNLRYLATFRQSACNSCDSIATTPR